MLFSLPWYDLPKIAPSTDLLARLVAEHAARLGLRRMPDRLERSIRWDRQWESGRLLLSQACGFDTELAHTDKLRIVATPRYRAPGCRGASYSSLVLVRRESPVRRMEDLRGGRCAINNPTSHSGANALLEFVVPLARGGRFIGSVGISGSHEASLRALAKGSADVACVDAVVVEILRRHRPAVLRGLRPIGRTTSAATPPFVTSRSTPPAARPLLREALRSALADPRSAAIREDLLLEGIEELPGEAYRSIERVRESGRRAGYGELAPCGAAA